MHLVESREGLIRFLAESWAKSGRACGWLYATLDRIGPSFSDKKRRRRLYNGVLMDCNLRDHVQRQIYFLGGYEPIEADLFLSLLKEGDTVIDAGANVGFYSLMLAEKLGKSGRVHAFEPVPENFEVLERHVELNSFHARIFLNRKALWNRNETLTFSLGEIHHSNAGGYSARATGGDLKKIKAEAVTLDDYVRSSKILKVDAIKMDIEGAEKFALSGASEVLAVHRPLIFLEVCRETCERFGYSVDDLWDQIAPFGYRIYKMGSTSPRSGWVDNFNGIVQSNVLLFPKEGHFQFDENWDDKKIRRKVVQYS